MPTVVVPFLSMLVEHILQVRSNSNWYRWCRGHVDREYLLVEEINYTGHAHYTRHAQQIDYDAGPVETKSLHALKSDIDDETHRLQPKSR